MPISVIISNLNGLKYLPRLMETLGQQQNVEIEIIVVDRHSTDGSLEYLRQFQDVRVVSETPITGLVSGYAAGAAVARHDLLFFCNEDMWFDPLCLFHLEQQICLSRGVAAADPWQWTYDGKVLIHGGTRFDRCHWAWNSPFPRRRFDFTAPLTTGQKVPFPCAGAVLMHRSVYDQVGGWDTSFFLDHEDIDLFIRVWQRGWECVSVPEAKVYHAVGVSSGKTLNNGQRVAPRRYISGRSNLAVIALKYYSGWALSLAGASLFVPLAGDVIRLRWQKLWLDLRAVALTYQRMGAIRRFRRANKTWSKVKPGLQFFLQKDMTHP